LRDLEAELGVPVSSSAAAQSRALQALGATKLVVARAYPAQGDFPFEAHAGCRILGTVTGDAPFGGISRLPRGYALELGRAAMKAYPEADTIMFPSPHWPVLDAIEPLEREFGVKVMGALQAIVWEALRRTGIKDRIEGFGSLLRK